MAVLALHDEPLTFADVVALTRYEEARVNDALADIREMFLKVNEIGDETTFQLGALTRAFVIEQSKKLDRYSALKERVEKYKRNFYPENPILSRLRDRVEALVLKGDRFSNNDALRQSAELVLDPTLSPKISEDPRFISLQAFVLISQKPPRIDDARRLFGNVFSMKFEPEIEHFKKWFFVERESGHGVDQCLRISDFIWQGKRYSDDEKIEFLSRKATNLYNRGKNDIYFSPTRGIKDVEEALSLHLVCYARNFERGGAKLETSENYARNTGFYLFNFLVTNAQYDEFWRIIGNLTERSGSKLDPLEEPLVRVVALLHQAGRSKPELNKFRNSLDYARRQLSANDKWYEFFHPKKRYQCTRRCN